MSDDLQGVLVVALEQAVAAPYCTRLMAESGARVIKLERPDGDFARAYDGILDGDSAYFVWLNSGKESLVVDLANPEDKKLLQSILLKPMCLYKTFALVRPINWGLAMRMLRR